MKKKRVIAILSILLILFSAMIPQPVFAEEAAGGETPSTSTSVAASSTTYSSKSAIPAEVRERIQNEILDSLSTMLSVNLFEKVKIPQCKEAIRVIKIALGDEQTAAVTRGKIAKSRVPETEQEVAS